MLGRRTYRYVTWSMSRLNSRIGRLCEEKAAEKYGFQLGGCQYADGRYKNGKPVEVKSTMPGEDGRFRIWELDHHKVAQQQGYYVFVLYRRAGRGVVPISMKRKQATTVTKLIPHWNKAGHELKDGRQYKLPPEEIFG